MNGITATEARSIRLAAPKSTCLHLAGWCLGFFVLLLTSCQHSQSTAAFSVPPREGGKLDYARWQRHVLGFSSGTEAFNRRGPFRSERFYDFPIAVSPTNSITADLYVAQHRDKSPLVIISHGNDYSKLAHRTQARRIASWGFHCLLLDLPNRDQWLKNAQTIDALVRLIHAYPQLLAPNIDTKSIILVGHSFGGSAVSLAAAKQGPVRGLVLLDPAVVHPIVLEALPKVRIPAVVLGADPDVFAAKKRRAFYENLGGPVTETNVIGATHTDAQAPSIYEVNWGLDLVGDEAKRQLFLSALLTSLFSITANDQLAFAWQAFARSEKRGLLKEGRRRSSPMQVKTSLPAKRL